MDRTIVYPGSIPLDTDLLSTNRNAMMALGYLAQAVLGTTPVVDGLVCSPTVPASMTIMVGPGSITQLGVVDALAYGSLPADGSDPLIKMGINITSTSFALTAPSSSGLSINYLLQATLQESDTGPVVLPYYNAANPALPFSGPGNAGTAQNTSRTQRVLIQMKAGAAAVTGTQLTPAVDSGWSGLYVVTVAYGQTAISSANITTYPSAPFSPFKLPALRPGFGSAVLSISSNTTFIVPNGVTTLEVEVWGAGAGSFASSGTTPSGGASGGGYARKRISGLTPGQAIPVVVGFGGAAGTTTGTGAGPGGTSSFGTYVSATGGSLNPYATLSNPQNGGTPGGSGVGGDLNISGSAGRPAFRMSVALGEAPPWAACKIVGPQVWRESSRAVGHRVPAPAPCRTPSSTVAREPTALSWSDGRIRRRGLWSRNAFQDPGH